MEELLLYWYEVIEKDLSGFADPRTQVSVDVSTHTLEATWVDRGRERSAAFRLSNEGDFRWLVGGVGDDVGEALPYARLASSGGTCGPSELNRPQR